MRAEVTKCVCSIVIAIMKYQGRLLYKETNIIYLLDWGLKIQAQEITVV